MIFFKYRVDTYLEPKIVIDTFKKELSIDTNILILYSQGTINLDYQDYEIKGYTLKITDSIYGIRCVNDDPYIIAHEMCHVKQYVDKRLIIIKDSVWFDNVLYIKPDYFFSPWEVEARDYALKSKEIIKRLKKQTNN